MVSFRVESFVILFCKVYFGPKGHRYTATLAKVEPGVFVLQAKLLSLPKTFVFQCGPDTDADC